MRTAGVPSGPTVARLSADGSLGSLLSASAYHAAKSSSGSDFSGIMTPQYEGLWAARPPASCPASHPPLEPEHDRSWTIDGRQKGPRSWASPTNARSPGASPRPATSTARSWPSPSRARRWKRRVRPLANSIGAKIIVPCDVTDAASIDATFAEIEKQWGELDFLVHAIAFSNKDELQRPLSRHLAGELPAHHERELLLLHRGGAARRAADEERRQPAHAHLLRRRARHAALQRHGRGQGRARGQRALPRGRPRRAEDPRQRHLGRPDQDAGLRRHRRLPLYPEVERAQLAAQAQRHAGGSRQRRPLPAVRPRHRRDRRSACMSMAATTSSA